MVFHLQQQRLLPRLRLPAAALPARRTRSPSRRALPVLGLGVAVAGNIYVGMPEASFVCWGAQRRTRSRASSRNGGGCRSVLARPSRWGRCPGPDARCSAPSPVPGVRAESFNVHKSGFGTGAGDRPAVGPPQLARPVLRRAADSASTALVRSWFGVGVGIAALAAMSGRGRRNDCTLGSSWRSAALCCSRSTSSECSAGSGGCRSSNSSSCRCSRQRLSRSRSRSSRGSASRWSGVATSVRGGSSRSSRAAVLLSSSCAPATAGA